MRSRSIDPLDPKPTLRCRLIWSECAPPYNVTRAGHPEHVWEGVPCENVCRSMLGVEQDDAVGGTRDVQLCDYQSAVDDLIRGDHTAR